MALTLTEERLRHPETTAASIEADAVVVAKFSDPRTVTLVDVLKKRRVRIIADFCDNHFQNPEMGSAHIHLLHVADEIVCNSQAMSDEIRSYVKRDTPVIDDPVEGRKNEPRFAPSPSAVRLCWYGHPIGLPFLFEQLQGWIECGLRHPLEINIVTSLSPGLAKQFEAIKHHSGGLFGFRLTPWSTEAVWNAIESADCILLPSQLNAMTRTKSANRLVEAIYGGRIALASRLPSYEEFADYCFFDDDADVVNALLNGTLDQQVVVQKIASGQRYIEGRFLPMRVSRAWGKVIRGGSAYCPAAER
jgi:hypothetical protein